MHIKKQTMIRIHTAWWPLFCLTQQVLGLVTPKPTEIIRATASRFPNLNRNMDFLPREIQRLPCKLSPVSFCMEVHKGQPLPLCRNSNFHCTLPLHTSLHTSIAHFHCTLPLHTSITHFHCTLPLQCSSILRNQLVNYCACVVDSSYGMWRILWLFVVLTSSVRLLTAANLRIDHHIFWSLDFFMNHSRINIQLKIDCMYDIHNVHIYRCTYTLC